MPPSNPWRLPRGSAAVLSTEANPTLFYYLFGVIIYYTTLCLEIMLASISIKHSPLFSMVSQHCIPHMSNMA